ncbi:DUF1906 domain-containing protein [Lacticaseibacillus rhamnosus]|nr:DUF1906 domain-containing protein [Lacticaseibacillus rhamnosus]QUS95780.1 DUF1906 domain-containing protein [Lacticaseibacillus rhamnosus]
MLVYYLLSGLQPKSNMQSCSGSFNYFNFSQPNVGLIYALQRAVGISADVANGNFGDATNAALKNVQLSVGSTGLLVKIVKYGLYLNSMYSGDFSESFGSDVATSIIRFRKFMKYPNETSGIADYTVIKGLVTSNGDTGRDSIALDTATQLTAEDVKHFRDYGFSIVGRYLTGTVGTDFKPKNLTPTEIKTILDGGMKFFPIYEDGGYVETYFTASQGQKDAQTAIKTALNLELPAGTVIYFAVDVDFQEGDIDGTVIPYIKAIQNILSQSIYNTGVYGTRNVCLHAEKIGIRYSFVANMSYGWSGNLGFKMPTNWAFDQFTEYSIYGTDIDQISSSGKDKGVSHTSKDPGNSKSIEWAKNYLMGFLGLVSWDFNVPLTILDVKGLLISIELDQEFHTPDDYSIIKIQNHKLDNIDWTNYISSLSNIGVNNQVTHFLSDAISHQTLLTQIDSGKMSVETEIATNGAISLSVIFNISELNGKTLTDQLSLTIKLELNPETYDWPTTNYIDWGKILNTLGKGALTVLAFGLLLWITGGLGAAAGASGGSEAVLAALGLA